MKKLFLAFVWHLHQPNYQTQTDDVMLMPWTRLNAVRTYSGMLKYLDKYPDLKLNFDISPVLLDALEGYANGTINDIHSNLTLTPVEDLTQDDMEFILNYFLMLIITLVYQNIRGILTYTNDDLQRKRLILTIFPCPDILIL